MLCASYVNVLLWMCRLQRSQWRSLPKLTHIGAHWGLFLRVVGGSLSLCVNGQGRRFIETKGGMGQN